MMPSVAVEDPNMLNYTTGVNGANGVPLTLSACVFLPSIARHGFEINGAVSESLKRTRSPTLAQSTWH